MNEFRIASSCCFHRLRHRTVAPIPWARPSEREHDRSLLSGVQMVTVENGGHFLSLDRPDAVIEQLKTVASSSGMGGSAVHRNRVADHYES